MAAWNGDDTTNREREELATFSRFPAPTRRPDRRGRLVLSPTKRASALAAVLVTRCFGISQP